MNPTPQQFTPAHFLSAARRAEAEGKVDLAMQFYRHVVEHYAATPEAQDARDAFQRLGQARKPDAPVPARAYAGDAQPPRIPSPSPPPLTQASPSRTPPRERNQSQPRASATRVEVPEPVEFAARYRIGRFLAIMLAVAGLAAIAAGIALGVMAMAGVLPGVAVRLQGLGMPVALIPALILSGAGVLALFLSQLALALFDGANAARELAAIERSKWNY